MRVRRRLKVTDLFAYGLPLVPGLYGLKCILMLNGTLTVGSQRVMSSFYLRHVDGVPAALAGLGYLALALGAALSFGDPPPETRKWLWRVLRGILRWGSLVGFWWSWERACQLIGVSGPWPTFRSPEAFDALRLVGMLFGIIGVLCFLWAMFYREAVKRELLEQGCTPLHIWWRPLAYWVPYWDLGYGFRVVYMDPAGIVHKAYCWCAWLLSEDSPRWGSRQVEWLRDQTVPRPPPPEPEVFVDNEILRPKLAQKADSGERRSLLLGDLDSESDQQ